MESEMDQPKNNSNTESETDHPKNHTDINSELDQAKNRTVSNSGSQKSEKDKVIVKMETTPTFFQKIKTSVSGVKQAVSKLLKRKTSSENETFFSGSTNAENIINLVLLGKTGNGKSSTGNTILKYEAFKCKDSMESSTEFCKLQSSIINGISVRVVDTPGLMDTRFTDDQVLQQIFNSMSLCPEGFSALLYVIKFGQRFTQEEIDVLNFLKMAFGEEFIRKFCILIITAGDTFNLKHLNSKKSYNFENWLHEQTGPEEFMQLLEECQRRVVLFYNLGEENGLYKSEREDSLKKLFTLIKTIPGFYTNEHFRKCVEQRERLIEQLQLPAQKQDIQIKLSEIQQNIQNTLNLEKELQNERNTDMKKQKDTEVKNQLSNLEANVQKLDMEIKSGDNKSHKMDKLINDIDIIQNDAAALKTMPVDQKEKKLTSLNEKIEIIKNAGAAEIHKGFSVHKVVLGGVVGSAAGLAMGVLSLSSTAVAGTATVAVTGTAAVAAAGTATMAAAGTAAVAAAGTSTMAAAGTATATAAAAGAGASLMVTVGLPVLVLGVAGLFIGYCFAKD